MNIFKTILTKKRYGSNMSVYKESSLAPKISVIIPARNEEKVLKDTIERLRDIQKQEYINIEIIVGVGPSQDQTKEIALNYADKVIDVGIGPSVARNEAAVHATGDILLFLDADTIPLKGAIGEIARRFQPNMVGTCAMVPDISNLKSWILTKTKNFFRHYFQIGCSEYIFCDRALFLGKGIQFNPNLQMGEIHDFFRRARKEGKANYVYLSNVRYQFSVRRYETLGYTRVILTWLKWAILRFNPKFQRQIEKEYWNAAQSVK